MQDMEGCYGDHIDLPMRKASVSPPDPQRLVIITSLPQLLELYTNLVFPQKAIRSKTSNKADIEIVSYLKMASFLSNSSRPSKSKVHPTPLSHQVAETSLYCPAALQIQKFNSHVSHARPTLHMFHPGNPTHDHQLTQRGSALPQTKKK